MQLVCKDWLLDHRDWRGEAESTEPDQGRNLKSREDATHIPIFGRKDHKRHIYESIPCDHQWYQHFLIFVCGSDTYRDSTSWRPTRRPNLNHGRLNMVRHIYVDIELKNYTLFRLGIVCHISFNMQHGINEKTYESNSKLKVAEKAFSQQNCTHLA